MTAQVTAWGSDRAGCGRMSAESVVAEAPIDRVFSDAGGSMRKAVHHVRIWIDARRQELAAGAPEGDRRDATGQLLHIPAGRGRADGAPRCAPR